MDQLAILEKMRAYYDSGATRSYSFRKEQLKKLRSSILDHEEDIYQALYEDLKKNREEIWVTETGMVIAEINAALRGLRNWMEPEPVSTTLLNFPSTSHVRREPLGVVLIIGPWNYPVQLMLNPLVGAIAAGNCAVIKPSELAPATFAVVRKIIGDAFPPEYILCVEGEGHDVVPKLMNGFTFNHVFFTGSTGVGRLIYKMAAEKLVPVTLELGGKTPCVVEADANIPVAARRIALTKFSNAGQMCVAPDYLLVHNSVMDRLITELKNVLPRLFGERAEENYNYGKIVNENHFDRLQGYLQSGTLVFGGRTIREKLFIEPTILTDPDPASPVMNDEIFGPILPVIPFGDREEAMIHIRKNPDPLAFYVFTADRKKEKAWLNAVPAGGVCINNCSWHLTNHHLPFGGRGTSGSGCYHGRYSFETFSHKKAVMRTPTWPDPGIRYPPFKGKLGLFKRIIR
ncbi:MAG: aldehyde dehydrogenase [Chitinophagaceae bacterium]